MINVLFFVSIEWSRTFCTWVHMYLCAHEWKFKTKTRLPHKQAGDVHKVYYSPYLAPVTCKGAWTRIVCLVITTTSLSDFWRDLNQAKTTNHSRKYSQCAVSHKTVLCMTCILRMWAETIIKAYQVFYTLCVR